MLLVSAKGAARIFRRTAEAGPARADETRGEHSIMRMLRDMMTRIAQALVVDQGIM